MNFTQLNIGGNKDFIQGNGNIKNYSFTEILLNHNLKSLSLSGSMDLLININPNCTNPQLIVKVEENIFPLLEVNNKNGNLEIGFKNNCNFSTNKKIEFVLQSSSLEAIYVVGSGDIRGNYYGSKLTTLLSGSGDLELYGNVEKLDATIQGSGDKNLKNLISQHATVKVIGSGDLSAFAIQSAVATVMGSGDINIYGTTLKINKQIIGSGDINFKKNYNPKISPFNFNDIIKKFDIEHIENNNSTNISHNLDSSLNITQKNQGSSTLIIEKNAFKEKVQPKENLLAKLKKLF